MMKLTTEVMRIPDQVTSSWYPSPVYSGMEMAHGTPTAMSSAVLGPQMPLSTRL